MKQITEQTSITSYVRSQRLPQRLQRLPTYLKDWPQHVVWSDGYEWQGRFMNQFH